MFKLYIFVFLCLHLRIVHKLDWWRIINALLLLLLLLKSFYDDDIQPEKYKCPPPGRDDILMILDTTRP